MNVTLKKPKLTKPCNQVTTLKSNYNHFEEQKLCRDLSTSKITRELEK